MDEEKLKALLFEKECLSELLKLHIEFENDFSMSKTELQEYVNAALDRIIEINLIISNNSNNLA
jgi:ribosome assembly protein YihI (activator of Der GTPase)